MPFQSFKSQSYHPRRRNRRVPSRIAQEDPDSDEESKPHGLSNTLPAISCLQPSRHPINIMDEPVPDMPIPLPVTTRSMSSPFISRPETPTSIPIIEDLISFSSNSDVTNQGHITALSSMANSPLVCSPQEPKSNQFLSLDELEKFLKVELEWEAKDEELEKYSPKHHLEQLAKLSISKTAMKKRGFIVDPLQPWELQAKKKCDVCHKQIGSFKRLDFDDSGMPRITSDNQAKEPPLVCKYHDGVVRYKRWTCCKRLIYENPKPCKGAHQHKPRVYAYNELESHWKFVMTPLSRSKSSNYHAAVAIDCEMGINKLGDSELIRLTLVDYFTTEILIDKLVYPDIEMKHFNTTYSGVTSAQLEQAKRRGDCLHGREAAREAVFDFVGPSTIVIGHSVENDLKALRWIHHQVVDTFVLEQRICDEEQKKEIAANALIQSGNAEQHDDQKTQPKEPKTTRQKGSGNLSLKTVTRVRLGRIIQQSSGHDSKEDAIAARDIARWHVMNSE
jgi:RNA exonuclease 1